MRGELAGYDNPSVDGYIKILQFLAITTITVTTRTNRRAHAACNTFHIDQTRCIAGQAALTLKLDRDFTTLDRVILTRGIKPLVASWRYQNVSEAMRAGIRLLEQQEAQIAGIHQDLFDSPAEAQAGDLAEGSGSDAIRRAFAIARARAHGHHSG